MSGGAVLAGAWLALRDRKTGAADLVAVTPTAPWRLWWARLGSVAVAALDPQPAWSLAPPTWTPRAATATAWGPVVDAAQPKPGDPAH